MHTHLIVFSIYTMDYQWMQTGVCGRLSLWPVQMSGADSEFYKLGNWFIQVWMLHFMILEARLVRKEDMCNNNHMQFLLTVFVVSLYLSNYIIKPHKA